MSYHFAKCAGEPSMHKYMAQSKDAGYRDALTMETRSPVLCCWVTKYNKLVRLLVPYKYAKHQELLIVQVVMTY
jgi:hypothetical protein